MARIPTPLAWKRHNFAVFEPMGMIDRLYAVAVSGLVAGPFAIYKSPHGGGFTLVHLPSQSNVIDLGMQNCCFLGARTNRCPQGVLYARMFRCAEWGEPAIPDSSHCEMPSRLGPERVSILLLDSQPLTLGINCLVSSHRSA